MAQKIKYVFDDNKENVHEIPAKLLSEGDFFSYKEVALFFDGRYSSLVESQLRVKRVSDMKTFVINPDDIVKIYRKINLEIERI